MADPETSPLERMRAAVNAEWHARGRAEWINGLTVQSAEAPEEAALLTKLVRHYLHAHPEVVDDCLTKAAQAEVYRLMTEGTVAAVDWPASDTPLTGGPDGGPTR